MDDIKTELQKKVIELGKQNEHAEFSDRELSEITLSLFYANNLKHGTSGHLSLMLVAKLARLLGFSLEDGKLTRT